jgi:hypothetical protein
MGEREVGSRRSREIALMLRPPIERLPLPVWAYLAILSCEYRFEVLLNPRHSR